MKNIWHTFVREVFHLKFLLLIAVVTFLYISFTVDFLNYRFIGETLSGNYPLQYKVTTLGILLEGIFTALSKLDATLLILTGILIGINISLLLATVKRLQGAGVKIIVGGGSMVGLASTGCASCGFSVLSVLGIGTGFLNFLPFGSKTLYMLSIGTLLFSIFYMTKKLTEGTVCKVERK